MAVAWIRVEPGVPARIQGVPISVLDRSNVRHGEDPATAVRETVRFAQRAEALGYHRFWVAEHHSVPGVAGAAPTVLAASIAERTTHIRVGTGGVMLPNHRPLVVAEQFGILEALHPGRIDLGLGRSVGFTGGVRRALGADRDAAARFGNDTEELLGYFTGEQRVHPGVHAVPAEGHRPRVFLLATGSGADLAAELGLALVIAPVNGFPALSERIDAYRARFRPRRWCTRPHVIVSVTAAVAETDERARRLLLPEAWSLVRSRTKGEFGPLLPPDELPVPTDREARLLAETLDSQISGTPERVRAELGELVTTTGADELLITTSTYDRERMLDSYTRLVEPGERGPRA